jgi:ABC-type phosphate transport system auxiliary subunit
MHMSDILPIVENQLEAWRSTGDRESLHQGMAMLTSAMERRDEAEKRQQKLDARHQELLAESNILKTELQAVHKRFDDTLHHMDKRFNVLTWMIGLGFTVVVTIASLYNFL